MFRRGGGERRADPPLVGLSAAVAAERRSVHPLPLLVTMEPEAGGREGYPYGTGETVPAACRAPNM
jgi:hypothetical protein